MYVILVKYLQQYLLFVRKLKMTANEVRNYFNEKYGLKEPWPERFLVDEETYKNLYNEVVRYTIYPLDENGKPFINGKLMFKNVIIEIDNGQN
jgi:hypothetical protein